MFTACFAKENNKGFFSLYNFHCSLKEKEAKIQVLKTQEDGQDLRLSSSNIESAGKVPSAHKQHPCLNSSAQAMVEQTHLSLAGWPHLPFSCFIRTNFDSRVG